VTGLRQVPSQVLARLAATDDKDLVMLYVKHYSPPETGTTGAFGGNTVTGENNTTSVCGRAKIIWRGIIQNFLQRA
jgi:hypothetical protein